MANLAPIPRHCGEKRAQGASLPPLEPGDHLDQKTFHARYEAMAPGVRAELIEGTVYMPSPLKSLHGRHHARLMFWLGAYQEATPGVDLYDNATVILGSDSEPQPDAALTLVDREESQTRVGDDGYLEGPPELVIEVASSTESYDLHSKKSAYERAGVKEYLVLALRQRKVLWFVSRHGRFEEQPVAADGLLRSEVFPGLWLDPEAALSADSRRLLDALRQGLTTPEHRAFAAQPLRK